MIITRSPLRITLGGGGTDVPSYYQRRGGFLMAATIDKYVYITLHQTFVPELIVKYSQLERVACADDLAHPIIREAFALLGMDGRSLEVTSMADIPAGTGLGSSGSFTTALLKALHTHRKGLIQPRDLAEQACQIEIERLREPIGKQDQYAAAFGGITCLEFHADGRVDAWPLELSTETRYNLEDNLLLFFTGYSRAAGTILKDQDDRVRSGDDEVVQNLDTIKRLAEESRQALQEGDLRAFAGQLTRHWQSKRRRSGAITNPRIDAWLELGLANGALGGKLVGAGGGGFLMFYAEDKTRLRHALLDSGLQEVRFRFDFEGTKVVTQ